MFFKSKLNKQTQNEKEEIKTFNYYDIVKSNISLLQMLFHMRPSNKLESEEYQFFLNTFITPIMGKPDEMGNFIHIVSTDGEPLTEHNMPRIAYTAHHDTVHSNLGNQKGRIFYNSEPINPKKFQDMKKINPTDTFLFINNPPPKMQEVDVETKKWNPNTKQLETITSKEMRPFHTKEISNCLGADCTAGIFIVLEMIKAKVPGVYCIFSKEEIGGVGSSHIVKDFKTFSSNIETLYDLKNSALKNFFTFDESAINFDFYKETIPNSFWIKYVDVMISFDRKNIHSIITRQRGGNCASQKFVESLSSIISPDLINAGYVKLEGDDTGTFTDSASFMDYISECTNISVGYLNQHSASECQNVSFLVALKDSFIKNGHLLNDKNVLISDRDPKVKEVYTYKYNQSAISPAASTQHFKGYGSTYGSSQYDLWNDDKYWDDLENKTPQSTTQSKYDTLFSKDDDTITQGTGGVTTPVVMGQPPLDPPVDKTKIEKGKPAKHKTVLENKLSGYKLRLELERIFDEEIDIVGENFVSNEFVTLLEHAEDDVEMFVQYAIKRGCDSNGYVEFAIQQDHKLQESFLAALIDKNIDIDNQEVIDFMEKNFGGKSNSYA